MVKRTTPEQLYNAAVAMNLAEGTTEHGARTASFLALFEHARTWTRLVVAVRVGWWRTTRKRHLKTS